MIFVGPDTRSAVDILAADSRVTLSERGSWLDAEPGDER